MRGGGIAIGVVFFAGSALADASLGANFGFGVHVPRKGSAEVFAAAPAQGAYFVPMPGLRFGLERGAHEGHVDLGGAYFGDDRLRFVIATANWQYAFVRAAYLTVGAGVSYRGVERYDAMGPTFGGGLGLRQRVSEDHGTIREELRVDWIAPARAYPEAWVVSARFGFDLWFR